MQGPALQSLSNQTTRTIDLVFIDADKQRYPEYLDWALRLTEYGSVIVADNVWRDGSVVDPSPDDEAAAAMARFNGALASNARLLTTFVSTRDGADAASLSLVRL